MSEAVETLSGDASLELPEFDAPPEDPLPLLESWLRLPTQRGVREPRALALATADAAGRPSNRIVLLKQVSPAIVFAFSSISRKGRDLATNPRAAGTLYWRETLQQVVFEGPVEADVRRGVRPALRRAASRRTGDHRGLQPGRASGRPEAPAARSRRAREGPRSPCVAPMTGAAITPRPRPGRVLARQPRPPPPPPALRQERRRLDPPAPSTLACRLMAQGASISGHSPPGAAATAVG